MHDVEQVVEVDLDEVDHRLVHLALPEAVVGGKPWVTFAPRAHQDLLHLHEQGPHLLVLAHQEVDVLLLVLHDVVVEVAEVLLLPINWLLEQVKDLARGDLVHLPLDCVPVQSLWYRFA